MRSSMRDFQIDIEEVDGVLRQALAQTYSANPSFASESDFKYELFRQLHGLEISGHELGTKLPGRPTCMLHVEANAVNGLVGQSRRADLLVCDPTREESFNYRTKVVIELKKSLNKRGLDHELNKFAGYNDRVRNLYVVSANLPVLTRATAMQAASERYPYGSRIEILDRTTIVNHQDESAVYNASSKTECHLVKCVIGCIESTLDLYGKNSRDPRHSFFWRNYEYENEKSWTFPCEGDFTAQLYHRLRSRLGQCTIKPEYTTPSAPRSRVDMFVGGEDISVGIEVKINYDNFKGKGDNAETAKLSRKFQAMNRDHANHVNLLVVIQGQDAHKGSNKRNTLSKLRREHAEFGLMYYDEREKVAVGPRWSPDI